MKRKLITGLIIIIIIGIIIPFSLIMNNLIILTRIYYKENYEVDSDNLGTLIDKAETLDYLSLIKYHDEMGEINNLTDSSLNGHSSIHYINRKYIESLKKDLFSDSKRFHWWLGHYHYLYYTFNVTEESRLYFTYNNNTMIRAQYENYEDIFVVVRNYNTKKRVGNWYINFTQVPYVVNLISISLNNTFLVRMILKYDYLFGNVGGIFYEVEHFLVLDANFQIIFIYIPQVHVMVA